jgi:dipicolinate synthase subunit A
MKAPGRLAVLGGDRREPEIARLAAADGFDVRVYGAPAGPLPPGVVYAASAAEALRDARVIVLPVPRMTGQSVFAPDAASPIKLDDSLLGLAARGAVLITGAANDALRERATRYGIAVLEYGEDDDLRSIRGPLIAEAALATLDEDGRGPAPGSTAAVVGLGAIGVPLVRLIASRGAHVLAVTRSPSAVPSDLADAVTAVIAFADLRNSVSGVSLVIATTGGRAVGADVLAALRPDAIVADVASPPGSFDCAGDPALSTRVLWLRALGGRQPLRLGAAQWQVIRTRLIECGALR